MRALVFLLIPINLLFFLWSGSYFGNTPSRDAQRLEQQLLPDQVKIVSRDEPPAIFVKAEPPSATTAVPEPPRIAPTPAPEPPPRQVCLSFGDLKLVELMKVETLLTKQFPDFRIERTQPAARSNFWVFIPPRANRQEAERKANELKQQNVPEYFIVQEPGPQRFAISLGIFSSREAARERLATLQAKGIRSAIIGERVKPTSSVALAIHGPETQADALKNALEAAVPKKTPLACSFATMTARQDGTGRPGGHAE